MHRCAVHKLTNWHIRQVSDTKRALTITSTSTRIGHRCISLNDCSNKKLSKLVEKIFLSFNY